MNPKVFIYTLAFLIGLVIYLYVVNAKNYKVKIDFCDNRKPVYIIVQTSKYPSNNDIETAGQAVPKYEGYLNVCNITATEIKP